MRNKLAVREAIEGYLFIAPWFVGFIALTLGPIVAVAVLSLYRYDIASAVFIGIDNYTAILKDPYFGQSLKVTFIYAAAVVPLSVILGLAIALMMNQKLVGLGVLRTIYFLPSIFSGVAVSLMWRWMFNPEFGIINLALKKIGLPGPGWLTSREWALPAIIIMSLWGVGGSMLIYLAGLQGIPTELYEAATVDGAGPVRKFFNITVPMISPVILFNAIIGIIQSFQVFTQAYVMTRGGPGTATYFYALYIFFAGMIYRKVGFASGLSLILFVIILVLTLLIFRFSKRFVHQEAVRMKGR